MESMTNPAPEVCPTKLIADQITSDDAFQHVAIASAIANMMLTENGGCAIALTGAWGSGKSTVVNLLEAELSKSDSQFHSFIFDSWAHQGDPLRRTFLETLIHWCGDPARMWTQRKEHWNSVLLELAKRKEKSTTTSSPNVRLVGAIGAISILLAPLGLQIYQKTQYQDHTAWDIAGFFLSALPALFALAIVSFWFFHERTKPEKYRKTLPSLVFTEADKIIESETSKTPDPTSVEFEKIYRDLMSEVLNNEQRRVLIVVDNLDRIDHQNARSIWATLRVFFDFADGASSTWRKRIWVLVPFDPEAIDDLWEIPRSGDSNDRRSMSRHFLEKTFQSTFRVPQILFSNWEGYLLSQLRVAFPHARHTDQEFHTIFRLYDRLKPTNDGPSPTPRNIKIFVNTIGALHRQWQEKVPLPEQAAFALISDRKPDATLAILLGRDAQQPTTRTLDLLLSEGWQRNIAALYFNVPVAKASEALLAPPIQQAIQRGDAKALVGLQDIPGFTDVFETFIEMPAIGTPIEAPQFARLAIAFSGVTGRGPAYEKCKVLLYRLAITFENWRPFDAELADGIKRLVELVDSDITPLIRSVLNTLNPQFPSPTVGEWCKGVADVLPAFAWRDEASVKREFRISGDASAFLEVIRESHHTNKFADLWKYMQPEAAHDDLLSHLAIQASEKNWDSDASSTVEILPAIAPQWNWPILVAGLQPRLEESTPSLSPDVPFAIHTLFFLAFLSTEARQSLEALAQNETLCFHFHLLGLSSDWENASMCCLALLASDTQLDRPNTNLPVNTPQWRMQQGRNYLMEFVQNPDQNPQLFSLLAERFMRWMPLDKWREIAQAKPDRELLLGRLLREVLTENPGSVSARELVEQIDYWRPLVEAELFEEILKQKAESGELASALMERPFSVDDQNLYLLAMSGGGSDSFREFLRESIRSISESDWLNAMKAENELIDLVLTQKKDGFRLGRSLQDAFDSHVEWKLNDASTGRLTGSWGELIGILDPAQLKVFGQRLLNRFKSGVGQIKGLLPYYGDFLATLVRSDGPEHSFERIRQIIQLHDASEVVWLVGVVHEWQDKSQKSVRDDWASRVETSLEEDMPENERGALGVLLAALKS